FYQLSGEDTADYEQPQRRPRAWRYWAVESNPEGAKDLATALEVVAYDDEQKRPALVESLVGSGRVLLFTTALDGRHLADRYRWNNYWADSSFGMIFANLTVGHVAGDAEKTELNYLCGQPVPVRLPLAPFFPHYSLRGPGLSGAESSVPRSTDQNQLQ